MILREEIIDLIRGEQKRQSNNFVPEGSEYLTKLAVSAEVLSHDVHGECLGFIFFYCNDPGKHSSYITLLMVSPDARGLGIGASLVQYVLTLTVQRGFNVCRLEVRKENIAAIKLYKKMGFCEIENRGDKLLLEAQAS